MNIHVLKIKDNKSIRKLFSKHKLLFLDQAFSSSDPFQILILQVPISRAYRPPSPSLSNFTLANWNPLQHNRHHCLPYFVLPYSTTIHHKYAIYQTICKAKTIKFIIKINADHNALWVKHATYQKVESLRAASLTKLDNIVINSSIFNTKDAKFSTKW